MKSILKLSLVAVVAASLVLAVLWSFAPQVMAQGPLPWGRMGWGHTNGFTGTMPYGMGGMMGMGGGRGGMIGTMPYGMGGADHSLIAVAAKTLGLSESDLRAELNKDKSIADVAKAKNVDLIKIIDAFMAPRIAQMSTHMAQEQVDAMVGTMKAHLAIRLNEKVTPSDNTMPMRGHGMWNR